MNPERNTLRTAVIAVSAILLIFGAMAAAFSTERANWDSQRQAEQIKAQILADTVTAALAFGDRTALDQYVHALQEDPSVEAVGVYDEGGRLVSSLRGDLVPARLGLRPAASGRSIVLAPVVEGGSRLGTVYISQKYDSLAQRAVRYIAPAFLILMAGIMFTVSWVDRRSLARANEELLREIAEREKAEAALRQSQKMEAVGRLTGGIAHDFNNMLAIVIGSLDLLHRRLGGGDDRLRALTEHALEGANRASNLTQRLLAFSRLQPLKPEAVDIGQVIGGMSEMFRRTLGETIDVETIASVGLWRAQIDRAQLESAILNLAINARDAMPTGGKLRIEAGNIFLGRDYAEHARDVTPGDYVVVAITDTGTGIPPEILEQIFEPFFTTKESGLGTGLGLSQVQGFIKQSGGDIRVVSLMGQGTSVKLYLPRASGPFAPAAREAARATPAQRRGVSVLVAEDEPRVRGFVVEALGELGYDAVAAVRAEQALELLSERPDVVVLLTDVVMPDMNGRVLADRARELRPDLKVVFMTGYSQDAIVHDGVVESGVTLLNKPFTVSDLERVLATVLRSE